MTDTEILNRINSGALTQVHWSSMALMAACIRLSVKGLCLMEEFNQEFYRVRPVAHK